jgi:hypothetical protein
VKQKGETKRIDLVVEQVLESVDDTDARLLKF